ncbi:MAG: carboxypeptidase-like regulatory domain-containing protein [Bacteroidota bacterium]
MRTLARFALVVALFLSSSTCTKDSNPVGPGGPASASMTGTAVFPSTAGVNLAEVSILLADFETKLDSANAFTVTGQSAIPALVMAAGKDSIPLLMAVSSGLVPGDSLKLDASSTALALVYLSPLICGGTPEEAAAVLADLQSLPELTTLDSLVARKLAANPRILALGDDEITTAADNVIVAFVNGLPFPSLPGKVGQVKKTNMVSTIADGVVQISPSTPVSGLQLKHVSGSTFKLFNNYGRWAYCVTPEDEFYVFPNGTLMDILRGQLPWDASARQLNLTLPESGNPIEVRVYGLGWLKEPSNTWDGLNATEQRYALGACISSVAFEFVPHVISTITNSLHLAGYSQLTKNAYLKVLATLFNEPRVVDRCVAYIRAGDYWGMTWFIAKWILGRVVNDPTFRETYLPAIALNISATKLTGWVKSANLALKTLVAADAITATAKTYLGIDRARYKTVFRAWSEASNFGSIAGSVHDKATGNAIEGAVVDLLGDENNPLNPSHHEVTGTTGGFFFENIQAGQKTLSVTKSGYAAASVGVTVSKNATTTVPIALTQASGKLTGNILNDIYIKNNVVPSNVKGETFLTVIDVADGRQAEGLWVHDGTFTLNLPAATYRVIAWKEDYRPDTVLATVTLNLETRAPDLLLMPMGYLTGTISFDTNNDGKYELQVTYRDSSISGVSYTENGPCPSGVRSPMLWIGNFPPSFYADEVNLVINPAVVTAPGMYSFGNPEELGCPGSTAGACAVCWSTQVTCTSGTLTGPMGFIYSSGGVGNNCNCGITDPGTLYIEGYGTELGEPIRGAFNATLAGWSKCECGSNEDPGCYRAYLDIHFRVLRGAK